MHFISRPAALGIVRRFQRLGVDACRLVASISQQADSASSKVGQQRALVLALLRQRRNLARPDSAHVGGATARRAGPPITAAHPHTLAYHAAQLVSGLGSKRAARAEYRVACQPAAATVGADSRDSIRRHRRVGGRSQETDLCARATRRQGARQSALAQRGARHSAQSHSKQAGTMLCQSDAKRCILVFGNRRVRNFLRQICATFSKRNENFRSFRLQKKCFLSLFVCVRCVARLDSVDIGEHFFASLHRVRQLLFVCSRENAHESMQSLVGDVCARRNSQITLSIQRRVLRVDQRREAWKILTHLSVYCCCTACCSRSRCSARKISSFKEAYLECRPNNNSRHHLKKKNYKKITKIIAPKFSVYINGFRGLLSSISTNACVL